MKWPIGSFSTVALLGLILLYGCASITTDSLQMVSLTSDPTDAVCIITGPKGFTTRITTPNGFPVSRGEGDLNVVCTKAGKVGSALIKEEVAGMTFGNILFGGLIGVAVDAGTGKMWKYPSVGKVVLFDKGRQPKEPQIIATPSGQAESTEAKKSGQPEAAPKPEVQKLQGLSTTERSRSAPQVPDDLGDLD